MSLPRLFAAGVWLGVTAASTAVVWTATSFVAADVMERPVSVIAHRDVVSELNSGSAAAKTLPNSIPPTINSSTTMPSHGGASVPARPPAPTTTAPPSRIPQPTAPPAQDPQPVVPPVQGPQPVVPVAPPSPFATAKAAPSAPPGNLPQSPPVTQPTPPPTATSYSTGGGVVRVACNGFFINLVSAIPNNGYAVNVASGGPANVDVHFVGSGQDVSVQAVCLFGQPLRYYNHNLANQEPTSP